VDMGASPEAEQEEAGPAPVPVPANVEQDAVADGKEHPTGTKGVCGDEEDGAAA
jgi:hypothetical protein